MTRIRIAIAIVLLLCIIKYYEQNTAPKPPGPGPTPATSGDLLIKYDPDHKDKLPDHGALLDSPTFRTWLEQHHIDWRIVPATTTFNADQAKFKKLDEQERSSDNWMYFDNGTFRGKLSEPLPKNEAEAESRLGRYVR